ncbi:MAG: alpha/beta fold hydrolase [Verrucomicrobiota bacterium]
MRFHKRFFLRAVSISVAVAMATLGAGAWRTGSGFVEPSPAEIGAAPVDLHAEEVVIPSGSGSTLHGWLVNQPGATAAVALFHGIHGNRRVLINRARLLRDAGYSVLLIDFQAHGESSGTRITFGYLEAKDTEAAIDYLHARLPGARVGAIGISLGGAALALAKHPLKLDAAVLESTFSTIDMAVENRMNFALGKVGPFVTPLLTMQLWPRLGIRAQALRPVDHLADAGCPLLIAGGASDTDTLISETQAMFAAAHTPKELWIVPAAGHVDLERNAPAEYREHVLGFLARYLKR